MKKPDRVDQMVRRAYPLPADPAEMTVCAAQDLARALLRNEHARVRRIARGLKWCVVDNDVDRAYNQALDDFLATHKAGGR